MSRPLGSGSALRANPGLTRPIGGFSDTSLVLRRVSPCLNPRRPLSPGRGSPDRRSPDSRERIYRTIEGPGARGGLAGDDPASGAGRAGRPGGVAGTGSDSQTFPGFPWGPMSLRAYTNSPETDSIKVTGRKPRMWTAHNDARGYSVFGDPAVRLAAAVK